MYIFVDFTEIIKEAWRQFDPSKEVKSVTDISARVSTNHVFRVRFTDDTFIIAKFSYFGSFKHFQEDHTIINVLANALPSPYENFLAKSVTLGNNEVYTYRYKDSALDSWFVFYNPITIDQKLPRILSESQIRNLGRQLAHFHLACDSVKDKLPPSSKTLKTDIDHLQHILRTSEGQFMHRGNIDFIKEQCDIFINNALKLNYRDINTIPVFVDWNLGNFSITKTGQFYSRWDYDWFRVSLRVMDFYFFSRVCSSIGDRTTFSYLATPLMEERFIWFLKEYHAIYPLTENEIRFMKEAYRFFILNYVIKDGNYFFHQIYASRLQREAYEVYFPSINEQFNPDNILKALNI